MYSVSIFLYYILLIWGSNAPLPTGLHVSQCECKKQTLHIWENGLGQVTTNTEGAWSVLCDPLISETDKAGHLK